MNVTLKNIGTLKEAMFDLDKDFIIFIGPNNTGKTYAAYCLYGLCKNYVQFREIANQIFPKDYFEPLTSNGHFEINLEQLFTSKNTDIIYSFLKSKFVDSLPQLFGLDRSNFASSSIDFSLSVQENLKKQLFEKDFPITATRSENVDISYTKKVNSSSLILNVTSGDKSKIDEDYINYISQNILYYFLHPLTQNWGIYFLPAERIGISVFSKDLFVNRFNRTNEILNLDIQNRNRVFEIMNREFNAYSLVVQDSINNYEKIIRTKERSNTSIEFQTLANELEEKILSGVVSINNDGDVLYKTSNISNLKIQATGSIIKSLASLLFYLRYTARKGQILIIDEPEINLHPDNQRLVARILAKLSKLEVKVIVSTHSDYFIRELNNLIMLNKLHPETKGLRKKYGYDETETLDYRKVGTYLFKDNKTTSIEVTPSGMAAATIDEEINKLNNTANDIYWTLFEN